MDDALNDAELNDFQVFAGFGFFIYFSLYSDNAAFSFVGHLFKTLNTSTG